jgi:hypothetical protein
MKDWIDNPSPKHDVINANEKWFLGMYYRVNLRKIKEASKWKKKHAVPYIERNKSVFIEKCSPGQELGCN